MKIKNLFFLTLSLVTANSCVSCYYVRTSVHHDFSMDREILFHPDSMEVERIRNARKTSSDSASGAWNLRMLHADSVLTRDFFGEEETFTAMAFRHADRLEDLSWELPAIDKASEASYDPAEKIWKRFRWFYTYYTYEATFPSLKDRLPLPLDDYLEKDEQEFYLRRAGSPQGRNGIEVYTTLDDLNSKFMRWAGDCIFKIHYDALYEYVPAAGQVALKAAEDSLARAFDSEDLIRLTMDDFVKTIDGYFNRHPLHQAPSFRKLYVSGKVMIDSRIEDKLDLMAYFEKVYMHRVTLPGKYVKGNPACLEGGDPVWKIDAYRLLSGNYVTEATSRTPNGWAFSITGLTVLLLLLCACKGFRK